MNEASAALFHYTSVISGEVMAALVLAILMFAMITYREHRRSSLYLFLSITVEFLFLIGDAASFYNLSIRTLPVGLMYVAYFLSYISGFLVLIPFSLYSRAFIMEKTPVKRGVYQVPVILSLVSVVIAAAAIFSGSVYGVVDGKMTEINGVPAIASLIQIFVAIYLPVVAITKRKQIGLKAVMLLGVFAIVPIALFFISYNYAGLGTALALIVVYVLLQSDSSAEKEKQKKELAAINEQLEENQAQLEEAAAEQEAQIEEISALNSELEERQTQLEEATAEQEAQIEEISALNSELEERQAQLEEAAAEQEAQIDEITALNAELEDRQAQLVIAREASEAANEAKTSFLFNMSHDIRTPMNAIIGYADLMERNFDDKERCRDYLSKIRGSSDLLLSLVNNILEMARIESGKTVIEEVPHSVLEIGNNVSNVFEELMREKNIAFSLTNHFTTPYIYIDVVKVNEIYVNLVSNAYKYTPEGGTVNVDVREMPSDKEGNILVQVTVADTGIGMSKEFLPHIYDEFSREYSSTESRIQGTGLGMPIVKKLIDLMNGTITIDSELGKGTTIVVTLPHRIADEAEVNRRYKATVSSESFDGKRILLAEDNDLNAEIATEILGEAGFTVDRAEDGIICVDKLSKSEENYYDLILMDIQMPNMDGYKATQIIRSIEDDYRRSIPIIAMTANAFEEDKREALGAGMNGHLAKPVNVAELMNTLAEVLG